MAPVARQPLVLQILAWPSDIVPPDTNGWNYVSKRGLTRYSKRENAEILAHFEGNPTEAERLASTSGGGFASAPILPGLIVRHLNGRRVPVQRPKRRISLMFGWTFATFSMTNGVPSWESSSTKMISQEIPARHDSSSLTNGTTLSASFKTGTIT